MNSVVRIKRTYMVLVLVMSCVLGAHGCGGDVHQNDNEHTSAPEEDWTQYPLRRDDPRAQLDPQLRDVPDHPGREAVRRSPATPEQYERQRRGLRYDVAAGTAEELNDHGAGGGGTGSRDTSPSEPDKDLFGVGFNGVATSPRADAEDISSTQEPLIFGTDNRYAVLHTTSVENRPRVKLFGKFGSTTLGCSGTLIGEKSVLTAGHCVYDPAFGGWATSIAVVPALDNEYMPFGQSNAVFLNSVEGWVLDQNNDYDFAMITLDRKVGQATGWHPLCSLSDSSWNNRVFNLAGYPSDLLGGLSMIASTGVTEAYDSTIIYHEADTTEGMSGSGLRPWGYSENYACAVHHGYSYYWLELFNAATRINNDRYYQIGGWITSNAGLPEASFPDAQKWIDFGGSVIRMAATTSKNGRYFDLFATDQWDQTVRHKAGTASGFTPWTNIGGYTEGTPAAVSRAAGLLDVFIRDPRSGGGIFTKAWNGSSWLPSQSGWWYLGADFANDSPSVVSWASNRLDVFTRQNNGNVIHRAWNGSWSAWENLGGTMVYPVAVVSRGANLIDIFAHGANGNVFTKAWNGSAWAPSQTGWWSLGGSIQEQPTVIATSSNRLDVFGRGLDNAVWTTNWTGSSGWSGWFSLGGQTTAPVAAVSRASGLYDIFIHDGRTGSGTNTKSWNGSSWWPSQTGWFNLGVQGYDVSATTSASNRLEVFTRLKNDGVGYRWWDGVWHL